MVGTTVLTVCVPTIPGRESLLSRCLASITTQASPDVEVVVVAGSGSLGDKANFAATVAHGTYMTVVDDDDWLHADYMSEVLPACREGVVDFIGLKVAQFLNGDPDGESEIRGDLPSFRSAYEPHGPTPKGLTRTALWRQVPMGNDYRADRRWCKTVAPLVGSHVFIDRAIYIYDYWTAGSAFADGECRDVGIWSFDEARVRRYQLDA